MSGLTRKKIKVRSKSGKTFQRSVMVRAEAIGKRASGKKLNSLNPWEAHHVEGVNTNTKLGERQKTYGSSGPGSDHSLHAITAGLLRNSALIFHARGMTGSQQDARRDAAHRRTVGEWAALHNRVEGVSPREGLAHWVGGARAAGAMARDDLIARHGRENVHEVYQDPRKHVR